MIKEIIRCLKDGFIGLLHDYLDHFIEYTMLIFFVIIVSLLINVL